MRSYLQASRVTLDSSVVSHSVLVSFAAELKYVRFSDI